MSDESEIKQIRLHADVVGHVQGVGFRYFVLDQARQLGLTGWVRNLPEGTVEVLAEGPKATLDNLLNKLQRGPTGSRVSNVRFSWFEASGEFDHFRVTSF